MATTRTTRLRYPLTYLLGVIVVALAYALYVGATERHHARRLTAEPRGDTFSPKAHQRQLSRMHARLRAMNYKHTTVSGEECFATTEGQAREKLIQAMRAAEPGLWDDTTDFSSWLPHASSFVCTEGLRQEEVDEITAALNTHTHVKPALTLNVEVENAPQAEEGHGIIQSYLGRDRYREQILKCSEKKRSDLSESNARMIETVTELLHLSKDQQAALIPLQARLRELSPNSVMQVLDERGDLVDLNEQSERDAHEDLQELLSLSERGFSILTEEQARSYREFATGNLYSEVLSQFKLTEFFLPIPEQIRETIKIHEEFVRHNQGEATEGQGTSQVSELLRNIS